MADETTQPDELLAGLAGSWSGTYQLWFEPGTPVSTSPTQATITSELGGQSALLRYDWAFEGTHHEGLALISRSGTGRIEMGWSDTFHYPGAVMHCVSAGPEANVLGSYEAEGSVWGWRTRFELTGPDELVITAWNVDPQGEESVATEARYTRAN